MRLLRLCKTSHLNIREKSPWKIKRLNRTVARRNCPCPNASPWEIKHLFCGSAREHGANPSPNPWPPPREMSRSNRFFSDGHCAENRKIINEKYPFKMKSHGLMSDAVTGKQSGLRSLLRWEVCLQIDWVKPEMHFSQITTLPLSSDTKATFFFFLPMKRLIWFQRCLKSIYGPEKCELSTARVRVPHS